MQNTKPLEREWDVRAESSTGIWRGGWKQVEYRRLLSLLVTLQVTPGHLLVLPLPH